MQRVLLFFFFLSVTQSAAVSNLVYFVSVQVAGSTLRVRQPGAWVWALAIMTDIAMSQAEWRGRASLP